MLLDCWSPNTLVWWLNAVLFLHRTVFVWRWKADDSGNSLPWHIDYCHPLSWEGIWVVKSESPTRSQPPKIGAEQTQVHCMLQGQAFCGRLRWVLCCFWFTIRQLVLKQAHQPMLYYSCYVVIYSMCVWFRIVLWSSALQHLSGLSPWFYSKGGN